MPRELRSYRPFGRIVRAVPCHKLASRGKLLARGEFYLSLVAGDAAKELLDDRIMMAEAGRLAQRLRDLRRARWPELKISQEQLGQVLGVSRQQVAQWESTTDPKLPPPARLDSYARVFALAPKSIDDVVLKLESEPTGLEAERYRALLEELSALAGDRGKPRPSRTRDAVPDGWFWRFDDDLPITIVSSQTPSLILDTVPEASRHHPDYMETLHHSDADAEIELFGHLRATNPTKQVKRILATNARNDDLSGHVVILGGGVVNSWFEWFTDYMNVPVGRAAEPDKWRERQFMVPADMGSGASEPDDYETGPDGKKWAVFRGDFDGTVRVPDRTKGELVEAPCLKTDVALIARMENPLLNEATVTLCCGLFSRGTYGAARAFTHDKFVPTNERYLVEKLGAPQVNARFWMLRRVLCDRNAGPELALAGTVDLSNDDYRLAESFQ